MHEALGSAPSTQNKGEREKRYINILVSVLLSPFGVVSVNQMRFCFYLPVQAHCTLEDSLALHTSA